MSETGDGKRTSFDSEAELEKRAIYENLDGKRINLNPEIPFNHKWFRGEFHRGPWGSDSSPYAGETVDRVRLSMMGSKMRVSKYNSMGSVNGVITAVIDPRDREYIGRSGWFNVDSLSREGKNSRRKKI